MTRFEVKTVRHFGSEAYQIWDNEKNEVYSRKVNGRGTVDKIFHPIEARLTCAKMNAQASGSTAFQPSLVAQISR